MKVLSRHSPHGSILVDQDAPSPIRLAARDFARDGRSCTGREWLIGEGDARPAEGTVPVIAAVAGQSTLLDSGGYSGLESVRSLEGMWDAYAIVSCPEALLIVGSNPRGVMYGLYKASERLFGTDPMVAFSDVMPIPRDEVSWEGEDYFSGEPTFRYRGIFINDEDALMSWKGEAEDGLVDPEVHAMIIESVCRMGGNMLAPPMWAGYMDQQSRELVEKRGLFYTASHLEVLLSNPQNYWDAWCREKHGTSLPYSFSQYPEELSSYWRETVRKHRAYTNIWPVGLRGVTDCALWLSDPGAPESMEERAKLVSAAIARQKEILEEELPGQVPVMTLTMRDEVLELFETGELDLPAGVILVWDDVGRRSIVRRLPTEADREKASSHGAYYHLQFCQDPRMQYLPVSVMVGEVGRIIDAGANDYLLFNAGNVREIALLLKCGMRMAWNPGPYTASPDGAAVLNREVVQAVYGAELAGELAGLYQDFSETENAFRVSQVTDCLAPLITTRELYDIWDNTSAIDWIESKGSVESVAEYAGKIQFENLPERCWCFQPESFPGHLEKWQDLHLRAEDHAPRIPDRLRPFFESSLRVQIITGLSFCEWAIGVLEGFAACQQENWHLASAEFRKAAKALDWLEEERKTVSSGRWENWFRGEYSNVFKKSLWTLKPKWHAEDTHKLADLVASL